MEPDPSLPSSEELADDAVIGELLDGPLLSFALLAAWRLGVLTSLLQGPRAVTDVAHGLGLGPREVASMLGCASVHGLVERGSRVALSRRGRALLDPASPRFAGPLLDLGCQLLQDQLGAADVEASLRREGDAPRPWIETLLSPNRVEGFVAAMDAHSVLPASIWPPLAGLDRHHRLLDIGGGAGTHAIAAVRAAGQLLAVVLELPGVCPLARRRVEQAGVGDRVSVVAGDMWAGGWPAADLHLFADVLHDWPPERARDLLARSFSSLPRGGRVLVHEMLLDDDRMGPSSALASDLGMLVLCGGRQYSRAELFGLLGAVGFERPEAVRVVGDWWLVSGARP